MEAQLKDRIITTIEKNPVLLYVDYRDSLSTEMIEKILESEDGRCEVEFDILELWDYHEQKMSVLLEIYNDFKADIESEMDFNSFVDEFDEYLGIDPNIEGLISNTPSKVFFYDTGLSIPETWNLKTSERNAILRKIKNKLSIKTKEHDELIMQMMLQASYGGNLVVYFTSDIDDMINIVRSNGKDIRFHGFVNIAIIDTAGGSGDSTDFKADFTLPFKKENIHFEESIKYNYSFEVCGMTSDWCSSTNVDMVEKKSRKKVDSNLNKQLNKDKELSIKFKETGKCTAGDMDITRHKNLVYINNYPCGTRCMDCGTFWID